MVVMEDVLGDAVELYRITLTDFFLFYCPPCLPPTSLNLSLITFWKGGLIAGLLY